MLKRLLRNKRGGLEHGFNMGYLLIACVIFVIMAFVLHYLVGKYIASFLVHDQSIPTHVYGYRAVNTCLAYQDSETKRFYPGIIDLTKYNEETLKKCYGNTKSFNFQLIDLDKEESFDKILLGFGASLSIKKYSVFILYEDKTISRGELWFGMKDY